MSIDLTAAMRWRRADVEGRALLADLQANVLKGHGRASASILFLRFDPMRQVQAKDFLRRLTVSDALSQLQQAEEYKRSGKSGAPITLCMLSAAGYTALGALHKAPTDTAFRAGLRSRQSILNDPPANHWERQFRGSIHAMVMLADRTAARVRTMRQRLLASMPESVSVVGEELGTRMESLFSPGEAIEHFGYVDGRSNPLMLEEDVEREESSRGGTSIWNPRFGLDTVLLRDPATSIPTCFGSLVVFRKLEQDVKGFKTAEAALARALHLSGNYKERAGAMVVGRFEDGTPVVLQDRDGMNDPVPNNFDYSSDPTGSRCPLHAHIRKVNPRSNTVGRDAAADREERSHVFARRGIPYGKRASHPNQETQGSEEMPSKGVGLLFIGYQSDIARQFEFVQARWANNPGPHGAQHGGDAVGVDPVIGHGADGGLAEKVGQWFPLSWGNAAKSRLKQFDFQGYVRMLGGEYFFAPSITGLKTL